MGRQAVAVIGGGWGDEGKGLMTDYWVRKLANPVVIRINGGCQAGHTVETITGKRHVFSHFGSGTFAGAPTYLSRFFVVNPTLFRREHEEFVRKFHIQPDITIDPDCIVTTPVEMFINQALEMGRGELKHGSCGVGFGETLERVKRLGMLLTMDYMDNATRLALEADIHEILEADIHEIVERFATKRIDLDSEAIGILNNPRLIDDYYDDIKYLLHNVTVDQRDLYYNDLVFEGAQGLELDQDYGEFPYVTRSNCGMRNVKELLDGDLIHNIDHLKVNYVTRAYATRHGRGPLPNESSLPFPFEDTTNVHNEWQEGLRWAPFVYGRYKSITSKDFALYGNEFNDYYSVERIDTMTHMDQVIPCPEHILEQKIVGFNYLTFGPTHKDVYTKAEWAEAVDK